jgi:hypothetical protein
MASLSCTARPHAGGSPTTTTTRGEAAIAHRINRTACRAGAIERLRTEPLRWLREAPAAVSASVPAPVPAPVPVPVTPAASVSVSVSMWLPPCRHTDTDTDTAPRRAARASCGRFKGAIESPSPCAPQHVVVEPSLCLGRNVARPNSYICTLPRSRDRPTLQEQEKTARKTQNCGTRCGGGVRGALPDANGRQVTACSCSRRRSSSWRWSSTAPRTVADQTQPRRPPQRPQACSARCRR